MVALRSGYTTGTTAAAAAMAAWQYLTGQRSIMSAEVPLPPFRDGKVFPVPIVRTGCGGDVGALAYAEARKEAGDDPDVTNGMIIRATIYAAREAGPANGGIAIAGGQGIGRVTLPGLSVPVGQAAINPVPLAQIRTGLNNLGATGLHVVISAPEGEARAKGTMNGRLGIIGGISILGTQGIVKPYSHAAYRESIACAMNIAKASGCDTVCLGTGRRSIALLQNLYPALPEQAFIVAGDFLKESLELARQFQHVAWGCFFGKLIKLAQGLANTHAHTAELDMNFLANVAGRPELDASNTAQAALEQILTAPDATPLRNILNLARQQAMNFLGKQITIHLFHNDGRELARA